MTFPDVTGLAIAYLDPLMDPVAVASRVPRARPAELIQVRRIGGTALPPVRDVARLDVIAWAETEPRAAELGNTARAHVWDLAGNTALGVACYRVTEFMGPRMDDDPETGTPRYWVTFDLAVRADDVIHRAS